MREWLEHGGGGHWFCTPAEVQEILAMYDRLGPECGGDEREGTDAQCIEALSVCVLRQVIAQGCATEYVGRCTMRLKGRRWPQQKRRRSREARPQYEMYLSRADWQALDERADELSTPLVIALRVAQFDFEKADYGRIYPDIAATVEISRILDYIPSHYHTPLADALRSDGWKEHGREQPKPCQETEAK